MKYTYKTVRLAYQYQALRPEVPVIDDWINQMVDVGWEFVQMTSVSDKVVLVTFRREKA